MRQLVQRVSSQLIVQYEIKQLASYDISKCYFSKRNTTNRTVKNICEIMFWVCLFNHKPPYSTMEIKTNIINNSILTPLNYEHLTHDEFKRLCDGSARISVSSPSCIIPFLAATLVGYTIHSIPDIITELTYIKNNYNVMLHMSNYYHHALRTIGIGDFMSSIDTTINNNQQTKGLIALTYDVAHKQNKHHIAFISYQSHELTEEDFKIYNAKLHIDTRTEYITSPDEQKLILILPCINKYVKFYHDPMITQINLDIVD